MARKDNAAAKEFARQTLDRLAGDKATTAAPFRWRSAGRIVRAILKGGVRIRITRA